MDIISNKPAFKRRVLLVWSGVLLALHIIFTLLSVYDAYISGDIMKKGMDTALAVVLPILALLLIYIRFGVLVSAYHSYNFGTLPFTLIVIVSLVLTRVSEHIVYVTVYADPEISGAYILSIIMSFMIDLAVVILLFLFSRSKKERQRTILPLILITCAFPLVITVIEESWYLINILIQIKAEYGSAALTMEESLSAIWSFVRPLINAVIGFGIMFVTHKTLKAFSKN
ncbi:MAG: hypothetical protein IKU19_01885 [Clostridia bacterium]|nr:hypothetical protein [Clostridia bacterium]